MSCPLCLSKDVSGFCPENPRQFFQCMHCDLVFVAPAEHYTPGAEKHIYDQHQNDPRDPNYHAFLNQLLQPLFTRVPAGSSGLDFGCGPGPAISVLGRQAKMQVHEFDPFYANDLSLLQRKYDFITATEVWEHLHQPRSIIRTLSELLNPGGHLGVMTVLRPEDTPFETWYYQRDPTHVCFYSRTTMQWITSHFPLELVYNDEIRAFIWRKT